MSKSNKRRQQVSQASQPQVQQPQVTQDSQQSTQPQATSLSLEKVSECLEKLTEASVMHTKTLADHEKRIAATELWIEDHGASIIQQPQRVANSQDDGQVTALQEDTSQANASQANAQSVNQTSKPTPVTRYRLSDGPTQMFKYWDYEKGVWCGPKQDLFAAKAAGNGIWEPVWVWITNGLIDHFLSKEEIDKYCP